MFSLMLRGRPPIEEPRARQRDPAPASASPHPEAADAQADWPKDVHLPDEMEDDEC